MQLIEIAAFCVGALFTRLVIAFIPILETPPMMNTTFIDDVGTCYHYVRVDVL